MLQISNKLFTEWNNLGLSYCHWKSNEHLVPGLYGDTDLDVLLSENDKKKGEQIMRGLDFLECNSQYGSRYPGVTDWIGFDKDTGKLIHIHLHFHLVTGHKGMKEYNLPWTEETLSTCIVDKETGVYVMEPNLEFLTLYTRIGLKAYFRTLNKAHKGKFRLGSDIKDEINYLLERIDWNKVKSLSEKYFGQYSSELLEIMKAEELNSINYLALVKLSEDAMKRHRRSESYSWWKKRYWLHWMKFLNIFNTISNSISITRKTPIGGKGLVIAFMGQDGAGKSTVTEEIKKWLTWKLDAKRFYMGSGEHFNPWQKKILKVMPKNIVFAPIRGAVNISMVYGLSKQVLTTINKAFKYHDKGGIALFDRYPQIEYFGINDGPKIRESYLTKAKGGLLSRVLIWMAVKEERNIAQACKKQPSVIVKLMLSPEESMRRKPEEKYEQVKQKHEIIRDLQFKKSTVYIVDATQPYEKEIIEIKNIIWRHIPK